LYRVGLEGHPELRGETRDDAAGEAFDKVAKLLGLPYPGGPAISALAERGDPRAIDLPRPMSRRAGLDFSYSGLKTAVSLELERRGGVDGISDGERADLAASFEAAVAESEGRLVGTKSLQELCETLSKPRKLMMLIKAGKPVPHASSEPRLEQEPEREEDDDDGP